jgi:putative SOS response-associated peptidase YedK
VCGRVTSTMDRDEVVELMAVRDVEAPRLPPSCNVAPSRPLYTVVGGERGRVLTTSRWGISRGPTASGTGVFNVRAESLAGHRAFGGLVARQRALVVVSGFYEWRPAEPDGRRPRQPFYFHPAGGGLLALAALWERADGQAGGCGRRCAILTAPAKGVVAPVHHRMPLALGPEPWEEWLSPRPLPYGRLGEILGAPDGMFACHPVHDAVNSVANDGPGLVLPASEPEPWAGRLFAPSWWARR